MYRKLLVIFLGCLPLLGMQVGVVTRAPVERLEKNLSHYIEGHPEDSRGFYALGRIHALAFAQMRDTITVDPHLDHPPLVLNRIGDPLVQITPRNAPSTVLKEHLEEAIVNYRKAIRLKDDDPAYYLGLAWMLQQGALNPRFYGIPPGYTQCAHEDSMSVLRRAMDKMRGFRPAESESFHMLLDHLPCALPLMFERMSHYSEPWPDWRPLDRLLARAWEDEAIVAYRMAHELSFDTDFSEGGGEHVITIEAAKNIIEIIRWHRTAEEATPEAEEEIEYLERRIAHYYSVPRAISPIIFPTDENRELTELVSDSSPVRFDLDGDGVLELWPWVSPNAAFLVWDPKHEGIESGLQLFGNVTWWMFWSNGYEPLHALDDDDDGWIDGDELHGIAVWRDSNVNGVSEEGEVIPAQCAGIASIAVHPTGEEGGTLCNRTGLRVSDGRILPTYDWTPMSIIEPQADSGVSSIE